MSAAAGVAPGADNQSPEDYKRSVREKATETIFSLHNALDRDPTSLPTDPCTATQSGTTPRMASEGHGDGSYGPGGGYQTENADQSYGAAVGRLRSMLQRTSQPAELHRSVGDTGGRSGGDMGGSSQVIFNQPALHSHTRGAAGGGGILQFGGGGVGQQYVGRVGGEGAGGPRQPRGDVPSSDEVVLLLQNEASRVHHLELDKKYLQDEIKQLRGKVMEVVEENRILHEELKRSVVQEIVSSGFTGGVGGLGSGLVASQFRLTTQTPADRSHNEQQPNVFDFGKWHNELERLKALHVAKTTRLEAQLEYTREEGEGRERELVELRSRLRMLESMQQGGGSEGLGSWVVGGGGMCLQCAQNEAILPPSVALQQQRTIESLTSERDELMSHVMTLKRRSEELKQREDEGYEQVKASVLMVEQAHMEMTQAMVDREQLRDELEKMRGRLAEHVADAQQQAAEQCDLVRLETDSVRLQLNAQIKELLERLAESQVSAEKSNRDKASTQAELELVRDQLNNNSLDYCKSVEDLKVNMAQLKMDRNMAVQQLDRLKQEQEQADRDRHAERCRLKQEQEDLRRRLDAAEKNVLEAKEECIRLHNDNQALEREAHLCKLARESLERNLNDDLSGAQKRAELREEELNALIDSLQVKHARTTGELEEYVSSHEALLQKLRDECRLLITQLENVTNKYKGDNRKLKDSVTTLRTQYDKCKSRCQELTEQHRQQSVLQEKMRERILVMDKHAQNCSTQVLELLAKESVLMRERLELANHVDFLHRELLLNASNPVPQGVGREGGGVKDLLGPDKLNLYYESRVAVDDILRNVRNEQIHEKEQEDYKQRVGKGGMKEMGKGGEGESDVRHMAGDTGGSPRRSAVDNKLRSGGGRSSTNVSPRKTLGNEQKGTKTKR